MTIEQFSRIITEIKGRTLAVSLFYWGDPYAHPDVDEMCSVARAAGLNVHLTTHFSYAFTSSRIERIARSGVTHLTVGVDAATQEMYELTRVGGRLDYVLSNLERLMLYKKSHKLRYPVVEVQHLTFPHHPPDEVRRVRAIAQKVGVDQFMCLPGVRFDSEGDIVNVVDNDNDLGNHQIKSPIAPGMIPKCHWPYSSMTIKYNGDVVPCCVHRAGRQHTNLDGKAILGNVFESSVKSIWNGPKYQVLRRFVSDPTLVERDRALEDSFCYGCAAIFEWEPTKRNLAN